MTAFLLGAVALFALIAVFFVRRGPPAARAADGEDPNLAWYQQRSRELSAPAASDDPEAAPSRNRDALLDDVRLRLLDDSTNSAAGSVSAQEAAVISSSEAALAAPDVARLPRLLLLAAVILVSATIYYSTGSLEDVLIHRQLSELESEDGDAGRELLLARIESRTRARADNLQYLGLLGRLYMAGENYPAASDAFGRLAKLAPEDPQALALAAQARFLAAGRQLDTQAQLFAEQALAVDSDQRTALGLLGMSAFESGAYGAAVSYWERLQALAAPGSPGYTMLEGVLGMARERAGLAIPDAAGDRSAQSADTALSPGISVQLALAADASADPALVLFVFARSAVQAAGMPVAVRRLRAADLPLTLRLSDADAMAGQRLSAAGEVIVSAQLSRNGQPGVANAVYSGRSAPVAAGGADAAVVVELGPAPAAG
ncbi:MAG: cytochrome c-type biogenesis protein CcmH [Halieaceae bacterium]|jgi:cytochrome c-type biogenesis protein CcmH